MTLPPEQMETGPATNRAGTTTTNGARQKTPNGNGTRQAGPYAVVAVDLWEKGWSPIPLPEGQKANPPDNVTGHGKPMLSRADVQTYLDDPKHRNANVGIRVPDDALGLDIDCYDGKQGAETLAAMEAELGPLPLTPTSSARDDGSGIKFFRVPAGVLWKANLVGIEIVQHTHRYAVTAPSIHPKLGVPYRWTGIDGLPSDAPRVKDLPELPAAWVEYLTRPDQHVSTDRAELPGGAKEWLTKLLGASDPMCTGMAEALKQAVSPSDRGRYDTMRDRLMALVRSAEKYGHAGIFVALEQHRDHYVAQVTGTRSTSEATDEYMRALTGACAKIEADREWPEPKIDSCAVAAAARVAPTPAPESAAAKRTTRVADDVGPVDGAQLLEDLRLFLARFVAYPNVAALIAHALWIVHTHLMDCWESTARIAFLSPEPGSGKSRCLEVTEPLVPRPVHAVNTTPAYLFRKVSDNAGTPTILYDEIDTVFGPKAKDNEDIRGMLNAGHRRGAVAGRCVVRGKVVETEELPAYCAVAVAGLNDLPDTLMSRAVVIRMRRRAPVERIEPWRLRVNGPEAEPIRQRIERWADQVRPDVKDAWPKMPPGIEDRNADIWEALLAVADAAGGDWPTLARATAVTVVTDSLVGVPSLGIQLLTDLRTIFVTGAYENLETTTVVAKLNAIEESPWADLNGRELNARRLSQRLRGYGVGPKAFRNGDNKVVKGYAKADLADPWSRYLEPLPSNAADVVGDPDHGSVTSVTSVAQRPPADISGTEARTTRRCHENDCTNVADPGSAYCWIHS